MKTLKKTVFWKIYDLTWSNDDKDLIDKISFLMFVFVLGSTVLNMVRPVSYGKTAVTTRSKNHHIWNYPLSSKFVWRVSITDGSMKCDLP